MSDWREVVARHSGIVWQTAWRILRNEAEASDCYQETFLSALQIAKHQVVWNWAALLRRLATNHALARLRQRRSAPTQSLDQAMSVVGTAGDPVQAAQATELLDALDRALVQLPSDQAEVFGLRFFAEMSNRQIAHQLGISANAVGVLLHRARQQIGQLLASDPTSQQRCRHD
jgi:RNA polymerase sigma-70 factor (ECF subfamily)